MGKSSNTYRRNPGGFVPPGGPLWKSRLESPGKRRTWWFRRRSPSGGAFVRMGKRRERDWGDGPLIRSQRAQECVERRAAGERRQPKRGRPRGRSRACSPLAMGVSRSSAAISGRRPVASSPGGGPLPRAMPVHSRTRFRGPPGRCAGPHRENWPEVGFPLPVTREGGWGLRRPPACGGLCRPEVGVPLRTAPSGPLSFRGTCIFTAIGFYVARPPAAGCAGPHRENWPEVGVPLPAARCGGSAVRGFAALGRGAGPHRENWPEVGVFVPPRHAADRP